MTLLKLFFKTKCFILLKVFYTSAGYRKPYIKHSSKERNMNILEEKAIKMIKNGAICVEELSELVAKNIIFRKKMFFIAETTEITEIKNHFMLEKVIYSYFFSHLSNLNKNTPALAGLLVGKTLYILDGYPESSYQLRIPTLEYDKYFKISAACFCPSCRHKKKIKDLLRIVKKALPFYPRTLVARILRTKFVYGLKVTDVSKRVDTSVVDEIITIKKR